MFLSLFNNILMESIKSKSTIKRKANEVTVSKDKNRITNKKVTDVLRQPVKNATVKEFALLKNISGYTNEDLAALVGITHRTIRNRRNNGDLFDIAQTERLRKLNHLFKEGAEIFSNKNQFKKWLHQPSYGLDYDTPSELLKQPGGLDKVIDELRSIKFGDTI